MALSQIHLGRAKVDLLYWQNERTKEMLGLSLGNQPSQHSEKRKADDLEEYEDNITALKPVAKKLEINLKQSNENLLDADHDKVATIKGLVCWKEND